MLARKAANKWLVRAHHYLELARTKGVAAAERFSKKFRNQAKLEKAIELISTEKAIPRT